MKTLISLITIVGVFSLPVSALAAKGGEKGPADKAYEHASDKASFKRDDNWKDDKNIEKEWKKEDKKQQKEGKRGDKEEGKEEKNDKNKNKAEKNLQPKKGGKAK